VAAIAQIAIAAPAEADEPLFKRDFLGLESTFNNIMTGVGRTLGDILAPLTSL